MSRSHKDSVGGHANRWMEVPDLAGTMVCSQTERAFVKHQDMRRNRQSDKALIAEGLTDFYEIRDEHEANAAFYDMIYEDAYDREQEEAEREAEEREHYLEMEELYYSDYNYDDYADAYYWPTSDPYDFYNREPLSVDPFADAGESLGDILTREIEK